jgi:TolB-like protein
MKFAFYLILSFIFLGCSATTMSRGSFAADAEKRVAVVALVNYTDTPQAGYRAANILEGVLSARGYQVINLMSKKGLQSNLASQVQEARVHNADLVLTGGVSEWRYKVGIDSEPAVSVSLKMVDVNSHSTIWSATGSKSSWRYSSIGETAHKLFNEMISK